MSTEGVTWNDVLRSWTPEKRASEIREPLVYLIARPLSLPLVYVAARLKVSPNAITVISWLTNFAALSLLASGRPAFMIGAIGVALLALVIDCTDGMVARLTKRTSPIGEWLDGLGAYGLYAWFHLSGAVGASRALATGHSIAAIVSPDDAILLVVAAAIAGSSMLISLIATAKFMDLFPSVGKSSVVARRGSGVYGVLFTIGRNVSFPSGLVLPITAMGVWLGAYDLVLLGYAVVNVAILAAVLLRCYTLSLRQPQG